MKLEDLLQRAVEIRSKYDDLNLKKRGIQWNEQQLMAGFVGDVRRPIKNNYGETWSKRHGKCQSKVSP